MRPALLLSSALLLGSHAFAWIALLPTFQGHRCRAHATAGKRPHTSASALDAAGAGSRQRFCLSTVSTHASCFEGAEKGACRHHYACPAHATSTGGVTASIHQLVSLSGGSLKPDRPQHMPSSFTALRASAEDAARAEHGVDEQVVREQMVDLHQHHQPQQQQQQHEMEAEEGEQERQRYAEHAVNVTVPSTFLADQTQLQQAPHVYREEPAPSSMPVVHVGVEGTPAAVDRGSKKGKSILVAVLKKGLALSLVVALAAVGVNRMGGLKALQHPDGKVEGFDLYWRIFLSGGVCASISHGWAVPLDVVKTRLQTDPERYRGILDAFMKIYHEEGPNMLLKGLGATVIGYSIQGSLKYGLYAIFKTVVGSMLPTASIFAVWVLASMLADFLASTALCPLEATRIRLVADPSFAEGTFDGLSRLIKSEGFMSIFRGMPAILAKQLPYTIVQLCGFELLTRVFYSWEATAQLLVTPSPWQWLVSFGSALITGIVASLASQPGDVILSRVNKNRSREPVLQQMSESVRKLGLKGLFCGTKARLLHVGTIVTIQLVIYDMVKQAVGLPATGAH